MNCAHIDHHRRTVTRPPTLHPNMSNFLQSKTAIVTGGSGTIGKAIAQTLLASGCNVFITGRNQKRLDEAAAELANDNGAIPNPNPNRGKVQTFQGDVLNEDDVAKLFDAVREAHGGVDLLVNNAGTAIPGATHELSVEDFDRVMRVNVTGPFICAREAIRMMKAGKKGGRIVNIGSISGYSPRPNSASYTSSKFALLGLSHSLSLDCRKDGIAVGIIHPGNVTPGNVKNAMFPERKEEGSIHAEDVAHCVLAMASLPYHANVLEMTVLPTTQPLVGRG